MSSNGFLYALCKFLHFVIQTEQKIEYQKQIIGKIPIFEPYAAFLRIDKHRKKFITFEDIKDFLKEQNVKFSDQSLKEVIQHSDFDRDNAWNFQEFLRLIIPNFNTTLRASVTQRKNYDDEALTREFELELAMLMKMEIEYVENRKIKLQGLEYFNGKDMKTAFKQIDSEGDNYLNSKELVAFFGKSGIKIIEEDAKMLMTRIGVSGDVISYEDFENLLILNKSMKGKCITYDNRNTTTVLSASTRTCSTKEMRLLSPDNKTICKPAVSLLNSSLQFSPINSSSSASFDGKNFLKTSTRNIGNINSYNTRILSSPQQKKDSSSLLSKLLHIEMNCEAKSGKVKDNFIQALSDSTSLMSIFHYYFDTATKGYVDATIFKKGLMQMGIYASDGNISLIYKRYDLNGDGLLDFQEFCNMLSSKNSSLNYGTSENILPFGRINQKDVKILADVFRLLIDNEASIDSIRKTIVQSIGCDLNEAFMAIKGKLTNYITMKDLKNYVQINSIKHTDLELNLLFSRFDKNSDGKITLEEFLHDVQ